MVDENKVLLGFLENILGKGKHTSKNNYAFFCPKCKHRKPKLEVNLDTHRYNCWTCIPEFKGKTIRSLLNKLDIPKERISYILSYIKEDNKETTREIKENHVVRLPNEFKSLYSGSGIIYSQARNYVKSRGITNDDILKYNIGYCDSGKYENMVIIPSYDANGDLNYFIGRSFSSLNKANHAGPECDKDNIIGFELFINWAVPIIVCEGGFDAVSIRRNCTPLFGKMIPSALMKKLVLDQVKTIYLALDKDALKLSINYAEQLINLGKEVYFINMDDKDPNKMGFVHFTNLLHQAKPFTVTDLFLTKLNYT
jgi:hypothetical protein